MKFKRQVSKMFKELDRDWKKAEVAALNKAAQSAFGHTLKFIREGYNIPLNVLKSHFRFLRATRSNLTVRIYAASRALGYYTKKGDKRLFAVKQLKKGVVGTVRKNIGTYIAGGFISQMPDSGHKGVFVRSSTKSIMKKGKYVGKERQQIKEIFAMNPGLLFVGEVAQEYLERDFKEVFEKEFARLLKVF